MAFDKCPAWCTRGSGIAPFDGGDSTSYGVDALTAEIGSKGGKDAPLDMDSHVVVTWGIGGPTRTTRQSTTNGNVPWARSTTPIRKEECRAAPPPETTENNKLQETLKKLARKEIPLPVVARPEHRRRERGVDYAPSRPTGNWSRERGNQKQPSGPSRHHRRRKCPVHVGTVVGMRILCTSRRDQAAPRWYTVAHH